MDLSINRLIFRGRWEKLFPFFDWGKTKAYFASIWEQGLYINTKGRERYGKVNKGREYETLRDEIIERLKLIEDPVDGGKLFTHIWKKEDIYSGPHLERAADIFFMIKDGSYMAHPDIFKKGLFEKPKWINGYGIHTRNGIFIAWGKDFKKNLHFTGAKIVDIAPTIFYSMGLPIPDDMDGRILKEIFTEEFIKRHPIKYKKVEKENENKKKEKVYSTEEERRVIDNLRGLGYID